MVVGAQNDASKVKFLKALEAAPEFERVVVHSETRTEGSATDGDPVTIQLAARYRLQDAVRKVKPATLAQKGAQ